MPNTVPSHDETLRRGARGPLVREISRLLVERGYLRTTQDEFDWPLKRAVEDFQAGHLDSRGEPLHVDGIVGPLTWWALRHDDAATPARPPDRREMPSGGSSPGRAALAAALRELEAGACEQSRNNDGAWVEKYLNGIIPPPANWCAGFVSWCYAQVPGGIPFHYSLGARAIRDDFRARGWLYDIANEVPQPGDIIVWWRGQRDGWRGHIGLVHHAANGILTTVEGNKGGFPAPVRTFEYVQSRMERLLGFGRVPG